MSGLQCRRFIAPELLVILCVLLACVRGRVGSSRLARAVPVIAAGWVCFISKYVREGLQFEV